MSAQTELLDPNDSVLLMVDHQSGLLQVVADVPTSELRRHVAVLGKAATLADVPVIATASVPEGPNGPLLPEVFDNAPHASYVARQGEINAWDVEKFRAAVAATGRRTLIVAGIITNVCVVEPALGAVGAGYKVYAVVNASGTYSELAQRLAIHRLTSAGVALIDLEGVVSELQQTWNRADAAEWAQLHAAVMPPYQALIESVTRAQAEALGTDAAGAEAKHGNGLVAAH